MQGDKHQMRISLALFLLSTSCFAAPTTIRVLDASGAPAKSVLVIVNSLDSSYQEASRQLTDDQSRVHVVELRSGVHRVIATTPYGVWETTIKEFLVQDQPIDLTLIVRPMPTHGFGDIVPLRSSSAQLQVLTPDG